MRQPVFDEITARGGLERYPALLGVSYSFVNLRTFFGLFCDDFLGTGDGLGFVFYVSFMSLDLATFLFHFLASLRLREQ